MKIRITVALMPILLILGFFGFLLETSSNMPANGSSTTDLPTVEIDKDNENSNTVTVTYNFKKNKPILILNVSQLGNINLDKLERDLRKNNVGTIKENNQLYLNLKDNENSKSKFKIELINPSKTDLRISDINQSVLINKTIIVNKNSLQINDYAGSTDEDIIKEQEQNNEQPVQRPSIQESNVSDSQNESIIENQEDDTKNSGVELERADTMKDLNDGWQETKKMMVSQGYETIRHDGKRIIPVLYFGGINYALDGITVSDSVHGRPLRPGLIVIPGTPVGTGRKNNLTAANSSIIVCDKSGNPGWSQSKKKNTNEYYSYTFGDGDLESSWGGLLPGKNVYQGTQRNFVTSSLFQNYHPSGDPLKPTIYGPDVEATHSVYGLDEKNVHLYYKSYLDDQKNMKTKQMIVFDQVCNNYKIRVKTTQEFQPDNTVLVKTEYKNVGLAKIDNFTGFTFRDITFIKDHNFKKSKQNNVLRSLGNHQGLYASRDAFNGRIEFDMERFDNDAYAWSGRGTKSTFFIGEDGETFPLYSKCDWWKSRFIY
ncbi:hypothetical protein [Companilactobacillus sp.]|uniref:hypothetical protein n=1 Tax=Companilactobacillus sp. TaxID=2767905 RepID=UPI002607275F|nr:hypothetical protein [Companilactobacillus sp.]